MKGKGEGMNADDSVARRLREIDKELAFLRNELGPPTDDPQDAGDAASALTSFEEQAAVIESLEAERRRLLGQDEEL